MLTRTHPRMTVLYSTRQATQTDSWEAIAEEYRRMLHYIEDNQLKMNGVYSESFLHIDPDDPANQITEIRIGII